MSSNSNDYFTLNTVDASLFNKNAYNVALNIFVLQIVEIVLDMVFKKVQLLNLACLKVTNLGLNPYVRTHRF
jgi:hypothetical protein